MKNKLTLIVLVSSFLLASCGEAEPEEKVSEPIKEEVGYPLDSVAVWEKTAIGGIDFLVGAEEAKEQVAMFKEACTVSINDGRSTALKLGAWHFDGVETKYYIDSLYEVTLYSEVRHIDGHGYSSEAIMGDVTRIVSLLTKKYGAPKQFQVLDQVVPKGMTNRALYYWNLGEKSIEVSVGARGISSSAPPFIELRIYRSDYSSKAFKKSQKEYEEKRAKTKAQEEKAQDLL
ncbi:MAG: hypothetical protein R2800_01990 [Flavipsychrobacter sp.]